MIMALRTYLVDARSSDVDAVRKALAIVDFFGFSEENQPGIFKLRLSDEQDVHRIHALTDCEVQEIFPEVEL